MVNEIAKDFSSKQDEVVSAKPDEELTILQERKQEMEREYQKRREAIWRSVEYLADAPHRELIANGSELATDIAIAELTFVALSKGLSVAPKTAEEFEVTSRPSKQTLKKVQDELAQAKRPLFTTPEGETVEVAGLVEEEASSATSLVKDTQKGKGKLPPASSEIRKNGKGDTRNTIKKINHEAHNVINYEKLKKSLTIEEITSVTRTTEHGVERLLQRGFSPEEIISLKSSPDIVKLQPDGAKVFIKEVSGKYTLLVEGEQGIVTALKNISEKSLNKLVKNYEWT